MDEALKQNIINVFDDIYVAELRHRYTGCLRIMTRNLLDYLLDQYGKYCHWTSKRMKCNTMSPWIRPIPSTSI